MNISDVIKISDEYIEVRKKRLAADKVAAKLKAEETSLSERLVKIAVDDKAASLPASAPRGINVHRDMKPRVNTDGDPQAWHKLHAYIRQYDAFDLLHKRLTEEAASLRLDNDVELPGVILFPVYKLTVIGDK